MRQMSLHLADYQYQRDLTWNSTTTHTGNTTDSFELHSDEKIEQMVHRFITYTSPILASICTITNFIVVAVFLKLKKKTIPNLLLTCSALADLFLTSILWFQYLVTVFEEGDDNAIFHYTIDGLTDYSYCIVLGTLLVSTVDRYISISRPFYHREQFTKKRTVYVVLALWIVSLLPPLIMLLITKFDYRNLYKLPDVIGSWCFHTVVIVTILIIAVVLYKTFTQVRRINRHEFASGNFRSDDAQKEQTKVMMATNRKNKRLLRIFIIMITTYTLTYMPLFTYLVLDGANVLNEDMDIAYVVCELLYFFSSAINPIVTLSMKEDFSNFILHCFKLKKKSDD